MSENRYDEAITAYEQAYESSQSIVLAGKLVQAYESSGQPEKAVAILNDLASGNSEDPRINLLLASTHQRQGNQELAAKYYQEVLDRDPNNVPALNNLAWIYLDSDMQRAYDLAQKASNLAPQRGDVADTLGWILVKQGRHEQGITVLRRAIERSPSSADIRYHLAFALAAAGERGQAREELQRILGNDEQFMEREKAEDLYSTLQ